ncbi:predicted protein [Streptomyces albidoflavus]|nr:predicted protein [Streptomyces albidoflavus]
MRWRGRTASQVRKMMALCEDGASLSDGWFSITPAGRLTPSGDSSRAGPSTSRRDSFSTRVHGLRERRR